MSQRKTAVSKEGRAGLSSVNLYGNNLELYTKLCLVVHRTTKVCLALSKKEGPWEKYNSCIRGDS
jgi:hypothetical protein